MPRKCMMLMTMSSLFIFFLYLFPCYSLPPLAAYLLHSSSTSPPPTHCPTPLSSPSASPPVANFVSLNGAAPLQLRLAPAGSMSRLSLSPNQGQFCLGPMDLSMKQDIFQLCLPPKPSLRRASHVEAKLPNKFDWRNHGTSHGELPKRPYMYSLPTLEFRYIIQYTTYTQSLWPPVFVQPNKVTLRKIDFNWMVAKQTFESS